MNREEFAAKRHTDQDELIDRLRPLIAEALSHLNDDGDGNWYDDLIVTLRQVYAAEFKKLGGEKITLRAALIRRAIATLNQIDEPQETTVRTTATALAVALLNFATLDAAKASEDPVVMEWVTMHDSDVRQTHRDVDGQQRPIGERFLVDGVKMIAPGDLTAPIELWINCRCVLAPTSPNMAASSGTVDQSTEESEVTETETETDLMVPMQWHGVLAPEGEWSGDGRMFAENSITFGELPLPLTWQKASAEGHDGSITVGSIDHAERRGNLIVASGTFLPIAEADELVGLLAHFGKFGVSVDADDVEFEFQEQDMAEPRMVFNAARVRSASVLPIPAFTQAYIALGAEVEEQAVAASTTWATTTTSAGMLTTGTGYTITMGRGPGWITNPEDTKRLHDYWTVPGQPGYEKVQWGVPGDFNRCRVQVGEEIGESSPEKLRFINQICAQWHHDATGFWPGRAPTEQALEAPEGDAGPALTLVAASGIIAPAAWFADPHFTEVTPLHVGGDGRVFGHMAVWGVCHTGFDNVCVEPPISPSRYSRFLTGAVLTDQGVIPVGHLTAGGGHAPLRMTAAQAVQHYDSTSTAVADVTCGEDDYGIWVAGWVRPGATDEQVYTLRASAISGDWRTFAGEMDMIAAHCVNSPGFPVCRVAAGLQTALVAAGVVMPQPDKPEEIVERIVDTLAERVAAALEGRQTRREKMAALAARVHGEED